MATSYTTILKLALPAQGELSGTWGDTVNNNITSMIEEAIAGRKVINTWSTNSATLSSADGTTSESRAAMLEFTDTGTSLSGAATVICPAQSKIYICKNAAGQTVTIKTSGGTGVAIPNGETMFVFCDGTNVEQAVTNISSLNVDGYALSIGGAITTAGAFTTSGANSLTLTTTGSTNVTLPTTGTLATTAGTETLTNKTLNSPAVGTAITLNARGEVRFGDADTSNYVGFEAPATVSSNQIWVLPAADGSNGQVLQTDGSGNLSFTTAASGGIASVSADTTPQLGGDLDTNGNSIVTTSNANVKLAPNGTGLTELRGNTNAGALIFNCESNSHGVTVKGPPHSANATYSLELPDADGSSGQLLQTNGSGKLSFTTVSGGSAYVQVNTNSGTTSAGGTDAIAIGYIANSSTNRGISIGYAAKSASSADISIGDSANTSAGGGGGSIGIGVQSVSDALYAVALGYQADAGHSQAVALGVGAVTTVQRQLMLGAPNNTSGFTSIRVGNTSYTPSDNMDLATKAYVDANAGGGGSNYLDVNSTGTAASATGTDAVAIGEGATAAGDYSVALGPLAEVNSSNTNNKGVAIGYDSQARGYGPIAIGFGAVASGTSSTPDDSFGPLAIGYGADALNYRCTAVGYTAVANSSYCTAIGDNTDATGVEATAVGTYAQATHFNSTALGKGAASTGNNSFILGNSSISDLRCQDTSITAVSDSRDKTNITALDIGLDFVETIEPKAFNKNNRNAYYDEDLTVDELHQKLAAGEDVSQTYTFNQTEYDNASRKFAKREFGFIAQDVAAALPSDYSDARVTFTENDSQHGFEVQRFTPGDMVPILWKAVQELSAKNKALEARIEALEG